MRLLDLTLSTPEENLAIDEVLLNESERFEVGEAGNFANVLRLWESPSPFVVIGRGSKRNIEANVSACEAAGVPILRRCSGGTAVVAGPGCLMYAVVLSYEEHPNLRSVDAAHQFVMTRMQRALLTLSPEVQYRGSCDLAIGDRKISGNSLRCKRRHFLYHGTVLFDFPLEQISSYLGTPPRMPDYRAERTHGNFLTNFAFSKDAIRQAIVTEWQADTQLEAWPEAETMMLAQQYAKAEWNERL